MAQKEQRIFAVFGEHKAGKTELLRHLLMATEQFHRRTMEPRHWLDILGPTQDCHQW
jgi:translation elongation factor EF-1alpha